MVVLAALDIIGALLAKAWLANRSVPVFLAGVGVFALLFWVYYPRWPGAGAGVFDTAEEMLARPVAKLLVRDETSTGDAMLEVARPLLATW